MEETHENAESTAAPKNKSIVILLVVIIALLAAAVAYFVLADKGSTDTTTTPGTSTTEAPVTPPAGMPGSTTPTEFDPATATVVAAGLTPEQHVTTYFDAVVAGDYPAAFKMLPAAKQAEYGDEAAFASQLTGYGITSYAIDGVVENGDETEVTATAVMPGGNFSYLWTFVKDGENWLVKSRTLPGMN